MMPGTLRVLGGALSRGELELPRILRNDWGGL